MSDQPNNTNYPPPAGYADIRQIVIDAVSPIKEQLDRLYDSLSKEFYRKDALEPQLQSLKEDLEELKQANKELKAQVLNTPQKIMLSLATLVGLALSILSLAQYIHLHP